MKTLQALIAIIFVTGLSSNAFAAQKIKFCGASALGEMEDALRFVQDNLENIMDDVSDLKTGEKRKLRNKITSVNLKCMDHKPVCNRPTLGV